MSLLHSKSVEIKWIEWFKFGLEMFSKEWSRAHSSAVLPLPSNTRIYWLVLYKSPGD
jgi:hypothetical protein